MDVIVTDHHRPATCCRTAPIVARAARGAAYPFPELCGTGVVPSSSRRRLVARDGGEPAACAGARQLSTSWRWPPWPTSCRSSTRTARWCARVCAVWRAAERPGPARADARGRVDRARLRRRPRLPARPAHQRGRPAGPPRRRAGAAADRRAREAEALAERARGAQSRAPAGRAGDPARRGAPRSSADGALGAAPRAAGLWRGLARGRDRHRRLAARRALRAARSC